MTVTPALVLLLALTLAPRTQASAADAGTSKADPPQAAPAPVPAGDAGAEPPPTVELRGVVQTPAGKPAPGVVVFAIDRESPELRGLGRSAEGGRFRMALGPRVHDFGIMSPDKLLVGFERTGPNAVRLTVTPAFPETNPLTALNKVDRSIVAYVFPYERRPSGSAPTIPSSPGPASIGLVSGKVTDERGAALGGVRLVAIDDRRNRLVAVTQSNARGEYTLATLAGPTRLMPYSPGLLLHSVRRGGPSVFNFVLSVDPNPEELTLRSGRKLSFRLTDSLFPEVMPPAKARAVINLDYGIDMDSCFCPGDLINSPAPSTAQYRDACLWSSNEPCSRPSRCPLTIWARQCKLPRYWWLRMLQQSPPNPTLLESPQNTKTMWWYDSIRAMQEADAKADAARKQ